MADSHGNIWTGVDDGRIIGIPAAGGEPAVIGDTGGRPLGLAVAHDGRLLVCDSPRGLLAMDTATGTVETLVDTVGGRHLTFCSNVIESSDGTIYFTESTSAFTYPHAIGAILEGRGRGSLFRRDPDGTVTTLLSGLYFANGVTLTVDESAVVFAETLARRLSTYWLAGPRAGSVTPLAVNLPGAPDNLSTGTDGRIWCAMVSPANPALDRLLPRAPILRKLVWRLPGRRQPIESEVWAVAFDPHKGDPVGGVRTRHPDFGQVTGLVELDGRLWMGCIDGSALAYTVL